jgi:hypothetical protein
VGEACHAAATVIYCVAATPTKPVCLSEGSELRCTTRPHRGPYSGTCSWQAWMNALGGRYGSVARAGQFLGDDADVR